MSQTYAAPMGYVVEGPDGGGKTHLARALRNRLFWPVVQVVQPFTPNIEQMEALLQVGSVIFDRYHLSPIVYGEVLRKGRELTLEQEYKFNTALGDAGYTLIVCMTDVGTMLANNQKADQLWDEVTQRDVLDRLVNEYMACTLRAMRAGLRTVLWDFKHQTPEAFQNLFTC